MIMNNKLSIFFVSTNQSISQEYALTYRQRVYSLMSVNKNIQVA